MCAGEMKILLRRPALLILILAALDVSCVTPKYVTGITSRGGDVKFLYRSGGHTGVIECKAAANGDLSECLDKPVIFHD